MVLCICGNGGVAIEKSCGDDSVCCNDSHAPNVSPVSEDQCNTCTDLPLNGLDAPLSYSSRTTLKIALDTHDASPLLAAATCKIVNNRGPAQPVVCAQSAATFSAVFRI